MSITSFTLRLLYWRHIFLKKNWRDSGFHWNRKKINLKKSGALIGNQLNFQTPHIEAEIPPIGIPFIYAGYAIIYSIKKLMVVTLR